MKVNKIKRQIKWTNEPGMAVYTYDSIIQETLEEGLTAWATCKNHFHRKQIIHTQLKTHRTKPTKLDQDC